MIESKFSPRNIDTRQLFHQTIDAMKETMPTRRQFLNRGIGSAALLSVGSKIPCFVPKSLHAADLQHNNGNLLVVIEMSGGNDGLNTIVPFRDDAYYRNRKKLRLAQEQLFPLSDDLGWHRSLRALNPHWDQGDIAVVQGVGYPNPNRSHFSSRAIWYTGEPDESEQFGLGWIGCGLDEIETESASPTMLSVGAQATPLALRGRRSVASTMHTIEQCLLPNIHSMPIKRLPNPESSTTDDLWSYVQRTHTTALETSAMLSRLNLNSLQATYPSTELANRLKLVAKLIRADMGTRVFYVQIDGFDTHASQWDEHSQLLYEFGGALSAFLDDIKSTSFSDRVAVMAFSEFGRRVKENAAEGTDHGTAGPVFLAGSKILGGLHGRAPSLTDLDGGDLKMTVDFRTVYASLLKNWLDLSADRWGDTTGTSLALFG